jgi:multidrug resistance efflux pump
MPPRVVTRRPVTANLNAARDNGASAAAINAAQRDITSAAQKQQRTTDDIARYAKLAQERLASGSLLTPANDSAASHAERLRLLDVRNPTTVPGRQGCAHAPDRRSAHAPQREQAE